MPAGIGVPGAFRCLADLQRGTISEVAVEDSYRSPKAYGKPMSTSLKSVTRKGLSAVVLTVLLGSAPSHQPVTFCSCATMACSEIVDADAVFEATVESIRTVPGAPGMIDGYSSDVLGERRLPLLEVELSGINSWRGVADSVVRTAPAEESCGYGFEAGGRYLIQASRREDDRLWVSLCSATRPVERAAGLIEYLRSLEGPTDETIVWGVVMVLTDTQRTSGDHLRRNFDPVRAAEILVEGAESRSTTTDLNGQFSLRGLPTGSYTIRAVPRMGDEGLDDTTFRSSPFVLEGPRACAEVAFLGRRR